MVSAMLGSDKSIMQEGLGMSCKATCHMGYWARKAHFLQAAAAASSTPAVPQSGRRLVLCSSQAGALSMKMGVPKTRRRMVLSPVKPKANLLAWTRSHHKSLEMEKRGETKRVAS